MKKIILRSDKHKTKNVLLIQFGHNDEVKNNSKKLENIFWSRTLKSFYTDLSLDNIKTVFNHLKTKE